MAAWMGEQASRGEELTSTPERGEERGVPVRGRFGTYMGGEDVGLQR